MTMTNTHCITDAPYALSDLRSLAETPTRLVVGEAVARAITAGADYVRASAAEDVHIYGVNTGVGALCERRLSEDEIGRLQHRLIMSHACGVGEVIPASLARFVLLVKLLTFRSGHTGISMSTVGRIVDMWNADVIPAIPKKGTLGASGDLAPLAHMALPLIGLGKVHHRGEILDARPVLETFGWQPLSLGPKEGLALINGVQYINAIAARCLLDLSDLLRLSDAVAAMSVEAFSGSRSFYDSLYHSTSRHEERRAVARNLQALLAGSNHHELPTANRSQQDPYSYRCIPQVHGAVRQAYRFAEGVISDECNSTSDNPLVFPDQDRILCGGNLHGQSTAFALDFLAIATTELASMSERRTYQLLSGERGLPDFLVVNAGLNSGFMVAHYTSAALVNENKVLSTPASVDTIPTSQAQEDSVSMGGTCAYKLQQIIENTTWVLAIELLHAAQGMDLNSGLRPAVVTAGLHEALRERVEFLGEDRVLSESLEAARTFLIGPATRWITDLE